jgi:hypothetical protein
MTANPWRVTVWEFAGTECFGIPDLPQRSHPEPREGSRANRSAIIEFLVIPHFVRDDGKPNVRRAASEILRVALETAAWAR